MRSLFLWTALALLGACSSSSTDSSPAATPTTDGGSAASTDGGATATYPASPYGTDVGETIADLSFEGWASGTYDPAKASTVKLDAYYDPSGVRGEKLLVINVCSVWCLPCKDAFASLKNKAADYAGKGVTAISILYENGETKPITLADAAEYGQKNGVSVPLFIDPAFQLSAGVRPAEVPAWIVVSARDMKILGTLKSTTDAWTFVDQKLAEMK